MISIREIHDAVCAEFGFTPIDMRSARKGEGLARARQIGMYFCRQLTTASLPEIGRAFGNRDHTTVMHAIRRVGALAVTDDDVLRHISRLKAALGRQPREADAASEWLTGQMGMQ